LLEPHGRAARFAGGADAGTSRPSVVRTDSRRSPVRDREDPPMASSQPLRIGLIAPPWLPVPPPGTAGGAGARHPGLPSSAAWASPRACTSLPGWQTGGPAAGDRGQAAPEPFGGDDRGPGLRHPGDRRRAPPVRSSTTTPPGSSPVRRSISCKRWNASTGSAGGLVARPSRCGSAPSGWRPTTSSSTVASPPVGDREFPCQRQRG
jgi:hypothetical protein